MASLTASLLASSPEAFTAATTGPFLTSAAAGTTPRETLGLWLANDRLYIHAYIRATGKLLAFLPLPALPGPTPGTVSSAPPTDPETKLLDWLVAALANVRREEAFFLATAERFAIPLDLPVDPTTGTVPVAAKLPGLRRWEALFDAVAPGPAGAPLPWLEAAVVFWGTEVCYLDAWTRVRDAVAAARGPAGPDADADGGALRREFIPNWTNDEFRRFVHQIGSIIDEAVAEQVRYHGAAVRDQLLERALGQWREVLLAEESFWPAM
ncbi:hypothetical protein HYQ45_009411 [Verticillium longisporum]|uniref:Thiaminase-2/PQQC domain-containing protein n=1 Tax=Verticillium longisporum TaxID=100787 RepID=A0A8I2ZIM3_VERLO|nr:hypothetical protein HYQ45_009411 [Verticillium longisporum]